MSADLNARLDRIESKLDRVVKLLEGTAPAKKDLTKVFLQFANAAKPGDAAVLDKKTLKRALKALGVNKQLGADEILEKMDANKDGTIDLHEWDKYMTPELRTAIEQKLNDQDKVEGFRPLVDVAKVFGQFDTDKSGDLSLGEIKRAMACLGLHKEVDVTEMFNKMNLNDDDVISLEEWKNGLPKVVLQKMSEKMTESGLIEGFKDDGRQAPAKKDLTQVFKQFANTATEGAKASLDKKKIKRALKALGVGKELNADDLLNKMDANNDGTIDLEEWDKYMTSELRAAIELKLTDSNKVAGFRPLVDMAKVFDQFDTDKSGDLSKSEIRNAVICLGLEKEVNVDELLKHMDDDENCTISIDEFRNNLPKNILQAMSAKLNEKGLIEGFVADADKQPPKKDLTKVFQQFANTATEGAKASLDKKKIKRALKALGVGKELNADDLLNKMDANNDGTIDLEEWDKYMTPELRAAIELKLTDTNKVAGFRPLVDMAKVFDQFDTDKSGDLSKNEIRNAVICLGLEKEVNVDELLKHMDDDENCTISIDEFRNNLPKNILQAMSAKLNEKGLIEGFVADADQQPPKKDLTKVFQQFANTATEGAKASLDKKKMKRALKALGVDKQLNADDILNKMDANNDGTIDLEEWEKYMTPELRAAIELKLTDTNKVTGFRPLVDMAKVFDQFDTDKSGDLSKSEIKNAIRCLGLEKEVNVDELLKEMDDDENCTISIDEFRKNLPKNILQAMSAKLNEAGLIEGFDDKPA